MALSSEINIIRYLVNSALTSYVIPFVYWDKGEIEATVVDSEANEIVLENGIDYLISIPSSSGGSLTIQGDWSSYVSLTIYRDLPYTQQSVYTNGQKLDAKKIETSLDKGVAVSGQIKEILSRTLTSPITEEGSSLEFPLKGARANKLIGFNEDGSKIQVIDGSDIEVLAEQVRLNTKDAEQFKLDAQKASVEASRAFKAFVGDGQHSSFTVNHNLGTFDYVVGVWENTNERRSVTFTVSKPDIENLVIEFTDVPIADGYIVLVSCVASSTFDLSWNNVADKPELYTQSEIDTNIYTKSEIDTNIYTKSEIDSSQSTQDDNIGDLETPTFTEASTLENIASGEGVTTIWGKIRKAISSLIGHINDVSNPHSVDKDDLGLGTTNDVEFKTIDTGYGANEVYRNTYQASVYSGGDSYTTVENMIIGEVKYLSIQHTNTSSSTNHYTYFTLPSSGTYFISSYTHNSITTGGTEISLGTVNDGYSRTYCLTIRRIS